MLSKKFNVVSILTLSGVLLGSAFTNPSKAMDEDPSAPAAPRMALSEEQRNQLQALVEQGRQAPRIAQGLGISNNTITQFLGVQQTNEEMDTSETEEG